MHTCRWMYVVMWCIVETHRWRTKKPAAYSSWLCSGRQKVTLTALIAINVWPFSLGLGVGWFTQPPFHWHPGSAFLCIVRVEATNKKMYSLGSSCHSIFIHFFFCSLVHLLAVAADAVDEQKRAHALRRETIYGHCCVHISLGTALSFHGLYIYFFSSVDSRCCCCRATANIMFPIVYFLFLALSLEHSTMHSVRTFHTHTQHMIWICSRQCCWRTCRNAIGMSSAIKRSYFFLHSWIILPFMCVCELFFSIFLCIAFEIWERPNGSQLNLGMGNCSTSPTRSFWLLCARHVRVINCIWQSFLLSPMSAEQWTQHLLSNPKKNQHELCRKPCQSRHQNNFVSIDHDPLICVRTRLKRLMDSSIVHSRSYA